MHCSALLPAGPRRAGRDSPTGRGVICVVTQAAISTLTSLTRLAVPVHKLQHQIGVGTDTLNRQLAARQLAQSVHWDSSTYKPDDVPGGMPNAANPSSEGPAVAQSSQDLREMCTFQLGLVFHMLSKVGSTFPQLRARVYARTPMALDSGTMQLMHVASFPEHKLDLEAGLNPSASIDDVDDVLMLTSGQGGRVVTDLLMEQCLLQQELVTLPSTGTLVMPLSENSVLVGLLVVDRNMPVADSATTSSSRLLPEVCSAATSSSSNTSSSTLTHTSSQGGSSHIDNSSSLSHESSISDWDHSGGAYEHLALTEEELQCFRLIIPSLSKACAIELKAELKASRVASQNHLQGSAARNVVRDMRRPLATLNTFTSILEARLPDGEPDLDLASGMKVQGKRLQELLWQLDRVLSPKSQQDVLMGSTPMPEMLPAAELSLLTSEARTVSRATRELLQVPQSLSASPQHHLQSAAPGATCKQLPAPSGASHNEMDTSSCGSGVALDADALSSSSLGNHTGSFPVLPPSRSLVEDVAPAVSHHSKQVSSLASHAPASSSQYSARNLSTISSEAQRTIDMVIDLETDRATHLYASTTTTAGSSDHSQYSAPGLLQPPSRHSSTDTASMPMTNLAPALVDVLTAACRLAAVSGINFIVNHPLRIAPEQPNKYSHPLQSQANQQLPRDLLSSSRSKTAPRSGSSKTQLEGMGLLESAVLGNSTGQPTHNPTTAADGFRLPNNSPSVLLPRPVRPILIRATSSVVQKIVSYVLDVALQSTPQGGQVCVSARQDGSGVQVAVLHTGKLVASRLHPSSVSAANICNSSTPHNRKATHRQVTIKQGGHARPDQSGSSSAVGSTGIGSGVVSLELAKDMTQKVGGRLQLTYPCNLVNVVTGALDVGTCVEIWLPGPLSGK